MKSLGRVENSALFTLGARVNGWQNGFRKITIRQNLLRTTKDRELGESHDRQCTDGTSHMQKKNKK